MAHGRPMAAAEYEAAEAASGYAAAHDGWGPTARYFASRLHVVDETLRACANGVLLDVGCGPGMLVRHLLDTRPGDFRITACDRSTSMIDAVAERAGDSPDVRTAVARIEDMPFPDDSFDVVVAMGVLEYADARLAIREIARVVRPGGLVVVTMLNPLSPYRLFEWFVYWPALRLLRRTPATGLRAIRRTKLCRMMREAGLRATDVAHYDLTPLLPPFDRLVRRWTRQWRNHPERTVSRSATRRWMGTAYLVTARNTAP